MRRADRRILLALCLGCLLASCPRPIRWVPEEKCDEERAGWCSESPALLFIETPTGRARWHIVKPRMATPAWEVRGLPGGYFIHFTSSPPANLAVFPRAGYAYARLCAYVCLGDDCGDDIGAFPSDGALRVFAPETTDVDWIEMSWEPAPGGGTNGWGWCGPKDAPPPPAP